MENGHEKLSEIKDMLGTAVDSDVADLKEHLKLLRKEKDAVKEEHFQQVYPVDWP
jgi:hypothetical protein